MWRINHFVRKNFLTLLLVAMQIAYLPVMQNTVAVCQRHPNVFAEITYTLIWYGMIEYLVAELGAQRVLYGSDCIMRDLAPQVGWVAWARIPLEAKRLVLGRNMAGILGLPAR